MKTKIRKIVYIGAVVLFVIGLGININMSLSRSFLPSTKEVIAQATGTGTQTIYGATPEQKRCVYYNPDGSFKSHIQTDCIPVNNWIMVCKTDPCGG